MNLIISRSGFCNHCFSSGRPFEGMAFTTFGSTSQMYTIRFCGHEVPHSKLGYVPLLYEKLGVEQLPSGLFVKYKKTCSMVNCGIDMTTIENKKRDLITFISRQDEITDENGIKQNVKYKVFFYRKRWLQGMMPANDWNALVRDWHKPNGTGYELDE